MAIENHKPSFSPAGIAVARVNFGVRDRRGSVPMVIQPLSAAACAILTKIAAALNNVYPERPVCGFTLEDLGKAANIGAKQAGYIVEALEHPTTLDSWGGDLAIYPRTGEYHWPGYVRTVQRYRKPMLIFLHPDFYRGELKEFLSLQHLSPWPTGPWPPEPRPRIHRGTRVARQQETAQNSVPSNQAAGDMAEVYTEVLTELKTEASTEVLTEVRKFSTEVLTEVSTELSTEVTSVHQEENTNSPSPPPQGSVIPAAVFSDLDTDGFNPFETGAVHTPESQIATANSFSLSPCCAPALSGGAGLGAAHSPQRGGDCVGKLESVQADHRSHSSASTVQASSGGTNFCHLVAEESKISRQTGKVATPAKESSDEPQDGAEQHQMNRLEEIAKYGTETPLSDTVIGDITRMIEALRDHGGVTKLQPVFADRILLSNGASEDRAMRWPDSSGVDQNYSRHVKLEKLQVNGRTVHKDTVPTSCSPNEFLKTEIEKVAPILSRTVQVFKRRGGKEKLTDVKSLGTHIYIMGIEGSYHDKNAMKYFVLDDVTPSRFHRLFREEGYFKHIFIQTSANKFQMIVFADTWLSIERRKEMQLFFALLNVPENEPPFCDPAAVSGERFFRLPGARNRKPDRGNFEAKIYDYKIDSATPAFECSAAYLDTAKLYLEGSLYGRPANNQTKANQHIQFQKLSFPTEKSKGKSTISSRGNSQDQSPSGRILSKACRDVRALCNKTLFNASHSDLYSVAFESIVKASIEIAGVDRSPKTVEMEAKKIVDVYVPQWHSAWKAAGSKSGYSSMTINQILRERRLSEN